MATITLKKDREDSLIRRHPWIFSGAIAKIDEKLQNGETVAIKASDGKPYGFGAYSSHSQIALRVWTFTSDEEVSEAFLRERIVRAVRYRSEQQTKYGNTCGRMIYAESDGLPGLIVDRYGDFIVSQFLSAGAEYWKDTFISLLKELIPCAGIYERSDTKSREKEGLPIQRGVLWGKAPPDLIEVSVCGDRFFVDIINGHKTGFYLDQKENRLRVREYMAGAQVLDCFTYTGGFAVSALKAGADHVTCIDSSATGLELTRRNMAVNQLDLSKTEFVKDDVFSALRYYRDSGRRFDIIVLDPPKFASSRREVERACRGYKDINLLACKLLSSGGVLITFSCSQHINSDLFQKAVAFAALDAGRDVQILEWLHQASDHPTALNFPEGNYLKGLICKVW